MPLDASLVGTRLGPVDIVCDARSLMSYAAGVGRDEAHYLDTLRPGGVVAHPMYPVVPEWALFTGRHEPRPTFGLQAREAAGGVHATHDIEHHRSIRQGDQVQLCLQVAGIEMTPPGALMTLRFDAVDAAGPVWTSWFQILYRGVEVVGAPVSPTTSPNRLVVQPSGQVLDVRRIAVRDLDAHVYGECSRIWNPIHTDPAVARAANLPGTVLHGTLTLAHGVSATMDMLEAGPEDVRRVGGAFRGMVRTPGELRVRLLHVTGDRHHGVASFDVATADDVIAVRDGFVLFGSSGQR